MRPAAFPESLCPLLRDPQRRRRAPGAAPGAAPGVTPSRPGRAAQTGRPARLCPLLRDPQRRRRAPGEPRQRPGQGNRPKAVAGTATRRAGDVRRNGQPARTGAPQRRRPCSARGPPPLHSGRPGGQPGCSPAPLGPRACSTAQGGRGPYGGRFRGRRSTEGEKGGRLFSRFGPLGPDFGAADTVQRQGNAAGRRMRGRPPPPSTEQRSLPPAVQRRKAGNVNSSPFAGSRAVATFHAAPPPRTVADATVAEPVLMRRFYPGRFLVHLSLRAALGTAQRVHETARRQARIALHATHQAAPLAYRTPIRSDSAALCGAPAEVIGGAAEPVRQPAQHDRHDRQVAEHH